MPNPGNAKISLISSGKRRTGSQYKTGRMSYTREVAEAFDFTTTEILQWELEAIRKDSIEVLPEGIDYSILMTSSSGL